MDAAFMRTILSKRYEYSWSKDILSDLGGLILAYYPFS